MNDAIANDSEFFTNTLTLRSGSITYAEYADKEMLVFLELVQALGAEEAGLKTVQAGEGEEVLVCLKRAQVPVVEEMPACLKTEKTGQIMPSA